jgi:hypothetical protein
MNEPDDLITTALRDLAGQAAPPRVSVDVVWRAGRRRRWAAITASVAGAAAIAVLVPFAVLGLSARPLAPGQPLTGSAGKHWPPPIHLEQVATVDDHGCPPRSHGLPGTSTNQCFFLTHTGMTISKFTITIIAPQYGARGYSLSFRLQRADIRPFADLTRKLVNSPSPRNQMAFVVNGVVLAHPFVAAVLDYGILQITAGQTRTQAEELLHKLEHR